MIPAQEARIRASHRPLYAQAAEALRTLVHGGGCAAGERLPSEHELSAQLGISRPTLREALHQLEEEGVIVRRHGVGTFVAEPRPVMDAGLEVLESLEKMAQRSGLHVEMGAAMYEERDATAEERVGLALSAPLGVIRVMRVIRAGGQPVAHLVDVLPLHYLRKDELDLAFHGSVLDLLLARGRPTLSHSRTELLSGSADLELARALELRRGAPLLRLEAQLFATDGQVVDYSISHFVPGSFRFHVMRRVAGA
jgi:GntR family transcriptional regulator